VKNGLVLLFRPHAPFLSPRPEIGDAHCAQHPGIDSARPTAAGMSGPDIFNNI
jgi:hypothetical protein